MLSVIDITVDYYYDSNGFQEIDKNLMLSYINDEIFIQFNDTLIYKLSLMKLILESGIHDLDNSVQVCGTMDYEDVWQDVCSFVFNNRYDRALLEGCNDNFIDKKKISSKVISDNPLLKNIVKGPEWICYKKNNIMNPPLKDTTIVSINDKEGAQLDIVTYARKGRKKYFIIFDAKYYNFGFEINNRGNISVYGNPGFGDLLKQYDYKELFVNFAIEQGFEKVIPNCFLFPSSKNDTEIIGRVDYSHYNAIPQKVWLLSVSADYLYRLYTTDTTINIAKEMPYLLNI